MKNIIADNFTSIGANHIKAQKVCEDFSGSYVDEAMCICVIADGHGSDNYPRTERGSNYAVQAAIEATKEFIHVADPEDVIGEDGESLLVQLEKNILMKWYQLVENDFQKNQFSEEELKKVSARYRDKYQNQTNDSFAKAYGTTLILFALTEKYSFGIQIGDGKCVVIESSGRFYQPIPWDDNCQMNVTTSICDTNAIEEFRHKIFKEQPVAVFCGSDGIDDSYVDDEDLHAFYRSILNIFNNYSVETAKSEIEEYLPILSKKGSGDDVSVAYIVDVNKSSLLSKLFDLQVKLSKLEEEIKTNEKELYREQECCKPIRERLEFLGKQENSKEIELEMNKLYKKFVEINSKIQMMQKSLDDAKNSKIKLSDELTEVQFNLGNHTTVEE